MIWAVPLGDRLLGFDGDSYGSLSAVLGPRKLSSKALFGMCVCLLAGWLGWTLRVSVSYYLLFGCMPLASGPKRSAGFFQSFFFFFFFWVYAWVPVLFRSGNSSCLNQYHGRRRGE